MLMERTGIIERLEIRHISMKISLKEACIKLGRVLVVQVMATVVVRHEISYARTCLKR